MATIYISLGSNVERDKYVDLGLTALENVLLVPWWCHHYMPVKPLVLTGLSFIT